MSAKSGKQDETAYWIVLSLYMKRIIGIPYSGEKLLCSCKSSWGVTGFPQELVVHYCGNLPQGTGNFLYLPRGYRRCQSTLNRTQSNPDFEVLRHVGCPLMETSLSAAHLDSSQK